MFELGKTSHWWEAAKRLSVLTDHPNILKPLGYAHIVNLIETFKPKRILEIGHGAGSYIFTLYKDNEDIEIWGLDDEVKDSAVSPEDLEKFKDWISNVKFVKGLLGSNSEELPENYFDLVYSVSVIEHIPHHALPAAFEETYRILKPGGIVSHTYDIYYGQDTSFVYNAFKNAGFNWLKDESTMNLFWEPWLRKFDTNEVIDILETVAFENPVFVAEKYMWQMERKSRPAPSNWLTVLTAARKPFKDTNNPENTGDAMISKFRNSDLTDFFLPDNFDLFTYSQKFHNDLFKELQYDKAFNKSGLDFNFVEIKTYQELLVYAFIKKNLKPGSKILEIGGNGMSMLLQMLKGDHEIWNVELLDETSLQKTDLNGINYFNDSFENKIESLQDDYFDLVYSVTAFKHDEWFQEDKYQKIIDQIDRILKNDRYALHCALSLLNDSSINVPFIVEYIFDNRITLNQMQHRMKIETDQSLYHMSEELYNKTWEKSIGKSFKKFGKPFSYNILWRKNRR